MQAGYIESNDSRAAWNMVIRIDDWHRSLSLIRYAGQHNNAFKYDQAQKRFQKMKFNKKIPQGANIWSYRIAGTEKKACSRGC